MWVPTEIDKAPAHRPESRNGLLLGVWWEDFSSFVVKKLCVCSVCVCNSPWKAEGGYRGSEWKPECLSLNELPEVWLQKPSERLWRTHVLGHRHAATWNTCTRCASHTMLLSANEILKWDGIKAKVITKQHTWVCSVYSVRKDGIWMLQYLLF